MLLAHGAGGGIDVNYGPILAGLADHSTVVGPDYPGSGGTPRADTVLTLDGLADALVLAAVEAGLKSFALSGYSLGGPLAVRAAVRHPERVSALILTATFAYPNPRLRLLVHLWKQLLLAGESDRLAGLLALVGFGSAALDRMPQHELDARLQAGAANIPRGTLDHLNLINEVDVRRDLPLVGVPTLIVSTTRDALVTPHHHHELARGIPHAEFEEIEAGHLLVDERPQEWLAIMRSFLSRVP